MKKRTIIILIAAALLLVTWCILFAVDYNAVMNLNDPVIAWHVGAEGGTYRGLGWMAEIEKVHAVREGEDLGFVPVSAEIYLFGKLVGAAIT